MGGACSMHGRDDKIHKLFVRKPEENTTWWKKTGDEWIILKCITKKQGVRVMTCHLGQVKDPRRQTVMNFRVL
jgi:hypothetical protein